MADARQQLVDFLEQKAFRPVLQADASKFPENKRNALKDMQSRTTKEVQRFHNYGSADDVVVNFKRDLDSHAAKKVHRTLKELGLPTLPDVREDFEKLAQDLGHH